MLVFLALVAVGLSACGGTSDNQTTRTDSPSPQVGETWYVSDHAYTDEVYGMIKSSGTATWPAQTNGDQPDKSFHLAHPYPCKVTEVGDDGFYKCDVDSMKTLDVTSVWTNRLLSARDADALDPGSVIHKPPPATPQGIPPWLKIRRGQFVYTGYDGGDATVVSVCASHSLYNDNSSGGTAKCPTHAPGIAAHIVSWEDDYTLDSKTDIPVVKIAANDGSWSGYTGSLIQIQPRIPVGTLLLTETVNNSNVRLGATKTASLFSGPELADRTSVRVLKQDAADVQNYDLYVQVVTGLYTGKKGWLLASEVKTDNRAPISMTP